METLSEWKIFLSSDFENSVSTKPCNRLLSYSFHPIFRKIHHLPIWNVFFFDFSILNEKFVNIFMRKQKNRKKASKLAKCHHFPKDWIFPIKFYRSHGNFGRSFFNRPPL
uniref:Uncharacterized protein n=1 Tax=Cacopsylla melanoneura TaxID=428564 RepID=A0A8D8UYA7_9HEMI